MAMREFLLYPELPIDDQELQQQSVSYRSSAGLPESSASSRIGLIPIQNTGYGQSSGAMSGCHTGPPKLHIISVLDKEFYVTRIRGTPRFNPAPHRAHILRRRNSSVLKHKEETSETTSSETETASYSDEGLGSERSVVFDRSQENYGLIYPKSSPRKVPAPRILSRFNPRHWAERPALKSQGPTSNHQNEVSVKNDATSETEPLPQREHLSLFSPLTSYE